MGIYLNEQNPSKLGWYIDRKAQITKTGQNADGSKTYHVTYTLTNTLTSSEMATCTGYILGGEQAGVTGKPVAAPGTSAQRMLFTRQRVVPSARSPHPEMCEIKAML